MPQTFIGLHENCFNLHFNPESGSAYDKERGKTNFCEPTFGPSIQVWPFLRPFLTRRTNGREQQMVGAWVYESSREKRRRLDFSVLMTLELPRKTTNSF